MKRFCKKNSGRALGLFRCLKKGKEKKEGRKGGKKEGNNR